jgi:hypothetical protein
MSGGAYPMESMSTSLTSTKRTGGGATGAAGWENPNYSNIDADA